jgi:hypothetical protein
VDDRVEIDVPRSMDMAQFLPTGDHLLPAELPGHLTALGHVSGTEIHSGR